jgi:hypothetical protein
MKLEYYPLLQIQRELQGMPRNRARFDRYVRIIKNEYGKDGMLVPLIAANPMAKDHVTALLDAFLALDVDQIAVGVMEEASAQLADIRGDAKVTLVVVDDLMGGWTNRYDYEYQHRFLWAGGPPPSLRDSKWAKWLKHFWLSGYLWSSEPATEQAVRDAILALLFRTAYIHRHGRARNLRELLIQEGEVMTMAGCAGPVLDADDIAYTREVLIPYLDASDMRTVIECMFGDAAGQTLGFTPRGLSHWAGLALALHDARAKKEHEAGAPN